MKTFKFHHITKSTIIEVAGKEQVRDYHQFLSKELAKVLRESIDGDEKLMHHIPTHEILGEVQFAVNNNKQEFLYISEHIRAEAIYSPNNCLVMTIEFLWID